MKKFIRDERGAGTVMGLLWFILLVGITGMAVDITDAYRNQTILQSTADVAALAGVIDLPDENEVIAAALIYTDMNMPASQWGNVLRPSNITIGTWDNSTRTFSRGGIDPDAVHVLLVQTEENGNPVATNFLRILGLFGAPLNYWNLGVEAIAHQFIPKCLLNGLVAREYVEMSAKNAFKNDICVHGQTGVTMRIGNTFDPGVYVTMPPGIEVDTPGGRTSSNPGLDEALHENVLNPWMVDHTGEVMQDMLDMVDGVIPAYININELTIRESQGFQFDNMEEGRVYEIRCGSPMQQVSIPSGSVINNVVIISNCRISVGSGVKMANVVLGSTAVGNGKNEADMNNITFSNGVELGLDDKCMDGGGVQVYSTASVHTAADMTMNGVQIVAKGNVMIAAKPSGINGISVQTGGHIKLTSQGVFGSCSGAVDGLWTVNYYRLVY